MQFKINPKKTAVEGLRIIPVIQTGPVDGLSQVPGLPSVNPLLFSAGKDTQYLFEENGQLTLLLGLGSQPDHASVQKTFRRVLAKHASLLGKELHLQLPESFPPDLLESALTGLQLGAYSLGHFKKERKSQRDYSKLKVQLTTGIPSAEDIADRAVKIAMAKIEAFSLVDLPPNRVTPGYLARWAKKAGKSSGLSTRVFDRKKAKAEGLEAFLAVSRGSGQEPQFIIMEYRSPKARFHLGLVGKGVTFDTGGLNIKTQEMVHMKSDMGGAAAVLAATKLIAELELPVNLTTVVPAVENSIDKDSYVPSEVIGSHAGLSIEVIDTDAEGRLILADALSYLVKNYQTDQLIDLATLTGSSVGTFGYECGALFSNSDTLGESLQKAGAQTGERLWPLPLWDSYKTEMDSDIADIRNYHGKPIAGAITAAKFLEAFIHHHPHWAHLDIAGVAFGDSEFFKSKSGTAFGVELILKFIENQL